MEKMGEKRTNKSILKAKYQLSYMLLLNCLGKVLSLQAPHFLSGFKACFKYSSSSSNSSNCSISSNSSSSNCICHAPLGKHKKKYYVQCCALNPVEYIETWKSYQIQATSRRNTTHNSISHHILILLESGVVVSKFVLGIVESIRPMWGDCGNSECCCPSHVHLQRQAEHIKIPMKQFVILLRIFLLSHSFFPYQSNATIFVTTL